jgi:DEAD/DEAH box helicase domain-containing protein
VLQFIREEEGGQGSSVGLCRSPRLKKERTSPRLVKLSGRDSGKRSGSARGKNYQEELDELRLEKSALQKLVSLINGRDTLNFFTDEGLIPNYAFPEAGVQLRSIIYRKKQTRQEGEGAYNTWVYEYERPAASAIVELEPAVTSTPGDARFAWTRWTECLEVETWSLCTTAPSELIGAAPKVHLPQCGSLLGATSGRRGAWFD